MRRNLFHGRHDMRQVRLAGLAERRRDANGDGVDTDQLGEVGRRGKRTGLHHRADLAVRHVEDVRLAPRDGGRPFTVDVEADDVEARPRERHGQRHADVAESDDTDPRLP